MHNKKNYHRMIRFRWPINKKKLLFTREKNSLNKKDVFFPGIEESEIRFSVRCKENELHRKYKVLGGLRNMLRICQL